MERGLFFSLFFVMTFVNYESPLSKRMEPLMARIEIKCFPVFARIGCFDFEQAAGQEVLVDLNLDLAENNHSADFADEVSATVDYSEVLAVTDSVLTAQSYKLVETMVKRLGTELLSRFARVNSVDVRITKPRIPFGIARGATIAVQDIFQREGRP
jgi:dihydroneopterin aldolase